jgi:hypothetical protein
MPNATAAFLWKFGDDYVISDFELVNNVYVFYTEIKTYEIHLLQYREFQHHRQ